MCNWKNWFWPGLVTTALLTALTGWFLSNPIEQDLVLRAGEQLKVAQPWSTVTFDGRDATISGVAENDIQQREAANITLGTYGVRIADNATTLPAVANPFTLSIIKDAAGITLSGSYASSEAKQALLAATEVAMPGIAIFDSLKLASGAPAGYDALSAFGASQLADMTTGEVTLSNLDYSVKGVPIDLAAYEKLTAASIQLPASGVLKLSEISVPDLGRPYEFATSIDGDTVSLNGYAPSAQVKADIEAQAKQAFSGKIVNNLLKLAGGAPQGFADLVGFGFKQLSTIGNGGFSISDMNYSVKGTPADTATYDAAIKLAENGLPAGAIFAASNLVKPALPEPAPVVQTQPVPVVPVVQEPIVTACLAVVSSLLNASQINFESSKAVIQADSFDLLAKIGAALATCKDAKIEIGGHTDSDGDDAYNESLSDDRAKSVRDYLVNAGVSGGKISFKGYGETQPVAANDTIENKAKNRRIEFRSVQ